MEGGNVYAQNESAKEFDLCGPGDSISQGDVLVEINSEADYLALIVVTADCDISHNKFGGRLTALPVVSLADYLRHFWLARELLTLRRLLAASVKDEMKRLISASTIDAPAISEERMLAWPLETNRDELAQALCLPAAELDGLYEIVETILRIDRNGGDSSVHAKWRTCCHAMFVNGIKSLEKARATLVKRVSSELSRQMPGDVLYLNMPMPSEDQGFVVLARFPVEVDPVAVAKLGVDEIYEGAHYRRVSRLRSPYRYRLTQLFSEVYSAIGLPDSYEIARSETFARVAMEIDSELW